MIQKIRHFASLASSYFREKSKLIRRSSEWGDLRDNFIKQNPTCAACGSKKHLQVHHIKPFHTNPELELKITNLITLCMDTNECHLKIGHGGSFKTYNPDVISDAQKYKKETNKAARTMIEESAKLKRKD